MSDAAETIADVGRRLMGAIEQVVSNGGLAAEWAQAANELYKEQYAKKANPYGEPWDPRPGDDKRTKSNGRFGRVTHTGPDGFALSVAKSNANRSCVPFEPRGLGAWKPRFDEILKNRMSLLFRLVRR